MAAGMSMQYPIIKIRGAILTDCKLSVSPVAMIIYPRIMTNNPIPNSW